MQVSIKKWGNSASLRIPASLLNALKLTVDSVVEMREEDGRIVIEPVKAPSYDLDALLDGITPENVHAEVAFGAPVGKEAL